MDLTQTFFDGWRNLSSFCLIFLRDRWGTVTPSGKPHGLEQLCDDFGRTCWCEPGVLHGPFYPEWVWGAGLFCCARTVGHKPSPWHFHSLWNNLFWLGKKMYFEQRKDIHSKIMENLGWMSFLNTVSFLSCASVQVCIHGFLVFLGQGDLHCRFRDPNAQWGQLGVGHLHCWALARNFGAELGWVFLLP